MTPQELQDLTRRMGEAAYQTWDGHGVNPLAIGLAALREMIPATDGGNCGRFCRRINWQSDGFCCVPCITNRLLDTQSMPNTMHSHEEDDGAPRGAGPGISADAQEGDSPHRRVDGPLPADPQAGAGTRSSHGPQRRDREGPAGTIPGTAADATWRGLEPGPSCPAAKKEAGE